MANKIYVRPETVITWRATGGDNDLTLTSLASGAGRQGEHHALDGGTGAVRSGWHAWRFFCKFATAPIVKEIIRLYGKSSDGTNPDNDDGTGDIAVSDEDKLLNLKLFGIMKVDEAATGPVFVASGSRLWIPHDDWAPVIWNATADALSSTAADHGFDLIPTPAELQ